MAPGKFGKPQPISCSQKDQEASGNNTQPIVTYIFLQEIANVIIRLSPLTWCFKRSSSVVPLNNKVQFKMQKKYQAPEKLQKTPCCEEYFSPWILLA